MTAAVAKSGVYTARVRWGCPADPRWEIETRHEGFRGAEDAALFANGFSTRAPASLTLDGGRLTLGLTDGSARAVARAEIDVWRLPAGFDPAQVADDASFELVETPLGALTEMGFDGAWTQLAYGVAGPRGETVDVVLEMDETGGLLVTTIDARQEMPGDEMASFAMGVVARA